MVDETAQDRPESPDVAVGPVLWGALGSLILLAGAVAGLHAIFVLNVPNRRIPSPAVFPQPQLQTDEVAQRQRIEQQQRQLLSGYAWADQSKGLVRIPIARAMDLIIARGANAYAPLLPASPALSSPSAGADASPGSSPATTRAKP